MKVAVKLLYDKVKSIISFSVKGLEPIPGDSDFIVVENEDGDLMCK